MNRSASFALLAGLLASLTSGVVQADPITYTIVNDAVDQNGYTLTGTITTDGTIGAISGGNITAWSYTITNGTNTYTGSLSDAGASTFAVSVTATATEIDVISSGLGGFLVLDNGTTGSGLQWQNGSGPTPSDYHFQDSFNGVWDNTPPSGFSGSSWDVANAAPSAVPEPSSLAMCGLAGLIGSAYAWRRRKRLA